MRQWKRMFGLVATLAIALAIPAFAHAFTRGGSGRGGFGGPGHGGPGGAGVLGQLIFPCQTACADTARTCIDSADTEAVTCVSGACSTAVTAAQTACADNRRSVACRTAVGDLRDCGATCLDTGATAIDACRAAEDDCRDACDSTP